MLFNLERDEGERICAYVVPDDGSSTPSIVLRAGGGNVARLEANNALPNLVEAGRHATGRCGFVIDETNIPGLSTYADLELQEASSGLMVYRRRPPTARDTRVFRFESHLLPLWRLDDALKHRFQSWHKGIDRFGLETATQAFCLTDGSSAYVSGRLLFKNFEFYLAKGIKTVGIIRDPYDELAERVIVLKNVGSRAVEILGERDALTFRPVIAALADYEGFDRAFCRHFFRRAPSGLLAALSNPLVRQLTSSAPDDMPGRTAMAMALDALASFDVLGVRSKAAAFTEALADLLDVDPGRLIPADEYPRVAELGGWLRESGEVEGLLEKDLELFHLVSRAFDGVDGRPAAAAADETNVGART